MSMETYRPGTWGRELPWEQTNIRAERALYGLEAVLRLLDAHEDEEAERLLLLIADRIKEKA